MNLERQVAKGSILKFGNCSGAEPSRSWKSGPSVKGSNARVGAAIARLQAAKVITLVARKWRLVNGHGGHASVLA